MEMRQLRYFSAVAECLNFTEAAKNLYVAQSAVSQQIAELEKELGVQLFNRTKRSVKLTNAGKVLVKEADFIINRMKEPIIKTREADLGLVGSLRIGFLGYAERSLLPPMIRHFRQLYPQIEVHLDQYHHGELIAMINNEELDIGFTLAFGVESMKHLHFMSIDQESIAIVMHKDHHKADHASVHLSDFAAEHFIVLNRRESPQGYQQTIQICANHGFTPNITHEPRLLQTLLMLVDAGMGVAVLPKSAQMLASKSVRFIELKENKESYELVAAWKDNYANPSTTLFIKELHHISKKRPTSS